MKSTIVIVLAFFIIIDKTSQEFSFPLQKKCNQEPWNSCNPKAIRRKENRTFIVIEEPFLPKTKVTSLTINKDPTIVRRKVRCICGLPVCKCQNENPERWFVKTFVKSNALITPTLYSIPRCNLTDQLLKDDCRGNKYEETLKKKLFENFCPTKKKINGCTDGPLYLIPQKKRNQSQKSGQKEDMSFHCECLQCRLQSHRSKSGVLMKCVECGSIYSNKFNEKNNFSKLIHKRKNQLKLIVKFLQIN